MASGRPTGTARRAPAAAPLRVMPGRSRARTGAARVDSADAAGHPANWQRPHVRTLVVASGKGGVGKSNLCANLAVALGQRGARVLLLDADLSQANLDLLLGVHPRYDLQHVLAGERMFEEIVVEGPAGVRLVPAASDVPELAELDDYRREFLLRGIGTLEGDADLVIMDTASGVSRDALALCLAADDVIVMTTPEMPAFADAYGLIKVLSGQGIRHAPHLLVSQAAGPEEAEETFHRIRLVARRFLHLEVDSWGTVPEDPSIPRAVRSQEPVVTAFPQSPAAAAYRALAARLWTPPPDPEADVNDPERQLAGARRDRQRLGA
jgi:flagellar biosynthesis protein FlhG